jgi:NAD(P)-dependent dehydrogenase (short-subunit alcohol dehydrogenase family)
VNRTALVTGGNCGIELQVCRQLATAGLDVAGGASVTACAERLAADGVEVDVLVNNAGIYLVEDVLVDSLRVNLFGAFHTCQAFVPAMVGMRARRVVSVSSGGGALTDNVPGPQAYGIAQAALNALIPVVADAVPSSVKVNAVEEGADTAVWLATLPDDGPTGGFFRDRRRISW